MGLTFLFMLNFYKQTVPNGTLKSQLQRSELFVEMSFLH